MLSTAWRRPGSSVGPPSASSAARNGWARRRCMDVSLASCRRMEWIRSSEHGPANDEMTMLTLWKETRDITSIQNVPRFLRSEGLSSVYSFTPGVIVVLKLPTMSSVIVPSSLSMTSTCRFAMLGTFLTFQDSFHVGLSVFTCTVDLRIVVSCAKRESLRDVHVFDTRVQFRYEVRIRGPDDIHLGYPRRSNKTEGNIDVFRLHAVRLGEFVRAVPGMVHGTSHLAEQMRHLQRISSGRH